MCEVRCCYVILYLILCFEVNSSTAFGRSRNHRRHSEMYTSVLMPSGTPQLVKDPTYSKRWNCHRTPKLIEITAENRMYDLIKQEMEAWEKAKWTFASVEIIKIEKIISSCLWNRYKYRRSEIVEEAKDAHEQFLFHGSPKTSDIIQNGFDERVASLDQLYGAGIYFSPSPEPSDAAALSLPDGSKQIVLCRVALGNMKTVQQRIRVAHSPVGYHSIKGTVSGNPEQFVVYRGEQVYPEYVITYK